MMRVALATALVAMTVTASTVAARAEAESIDSLQGQFAFNWHTEPAKTRCAEVKGELLSLLKSDAFQCNMQVITNTASGEPARVCTQTGDGAEYLIFQTQKACEDERLTQASNSEE